MRISGHPRCFIPVFGYRPAPPHSAQTKMLSWSQQPSMAIFLKTFRAEHALLHKNKTRRLKTFSCTVSKLHAPRASPPAIKHRDDGHDNPPQDRRVGVSVRRRGGIGAGVLLPAAASRVLDDRHRAAARPEQRVGVALLLDVSLRHAACGCFHSLTHRFKRTTASVYRGRFLIQKLGPIGASWSRSLLRGL